MQLSILRAGIIALSLMFLISTASASVVVNSEDWKDVYAGLQYAEQQDKNAFFTRSSSASGVLSDIGAAENYTLIQSENEYFLQNLDNQMETRGMEITESIEIESNADLVDEDEENFIVVPENDPSAALPSSSLARSINGTVIIATDENTDQVEEILDEQAEQVIMVGEFTTSLQNSVESFADEHYDNPNNFELSVEIAERIEEEEEFSSALITDGRTIEGDLVSGQNPILITGSNFLAEETAEYIIQNENIQTTEFIGAGLGSVAQDLNSEANENDRDIGVFVKFGSATPGDNFQEEVLGLDMFPLPTGELDLSITLAQYVPDQDIFLAGYTNQGSSSVHASSIITILDNDGNEITGISDEDTQFIPGESTEIIAYDLDIDAEQIEENGAAEFTTNYGNSPDNLNEVIESEEEGVFEPPRTMPISLVDVEDQSQVEIEEATYIENRDRFEIQVENIGEVTAYTRANILGIEIEGVERFFSSDINQLESGETAILEIEAEDLTQQDLEQNENVTVQLNYGEFDDFLIQETQTAAELQTEDDNTIRLILLVTLAVLLIILVVKKRSNNTSY